MVADVVKAMDPAATVRQGEWVTGPDGERELDVVVTGAADGQRRTLLIECKDFARDRTGPVGIGHVDALESKRRDLGVDAALLCSNAGFTTPAIRKAGRVGIGLIGVMKQGDARIRVLIPETLYTRVIEVEELKMELRLAGAPSDHGEVPFESVLYNGVPLGNWINLCVEGLLASNPIVKGRFKGSYRLKEPIMVELPTGLASLEWIGFRLAITGGWYAQEVTYDASTGLYDWLRRRVRLVPGPSQFHINNVQIPGGDPINRPPDHVLSNEILYGEMRMALLMVNGLGAPDPRPDIERFVHPDDLDFVIEDLPPDVYTSDEPAAA